MATDFKIECITEMQLGILRFCWAKLYKRLTMVEKRCIPFKSCVVQFLYLLPAKKF